VDRPVVEEASGGPQTYRQQRGHPRLRRVLLTTPGPVARQFLPGCLGASLTAQPLRRVFYTLSAWQDRDALYAFATKQPHRSITASLRSTMRTATFTFWDVPAEQLPLTWDDAHRRLAEQAQADRASASRDQGGDI
jgi:Domain of unknown function (DUF3291)